MMDGVGNLPRSSQKFNNGSKTCMGLGTIAGGWVKVSQESLATFGFVENWL